MNVDDFLPRDIKIKSNGSTDSVSNQGQVVPLPEQPSDISGQKKSSETKSTSYLPSILKGGNIADITKSVTSLVAKDADPKGKEIVYNFFANNARGFVGALPLICKGVKCPFIKFCPLNQAKMELPIDNPCPVEQGLVQIWVNKHLDALGIKDYNDPSNSFDMDIIYELAAHELIRWRIGAALSKDGALSKEKVTSFSLQGEPVFEEIVSPLLEHLETHSRISLKLKEALVATRREQIEAGRAVGSNDKPSDLVIKARNIMKARHEAQNESIKDADFDVK